ncbi:MAG: hypothetical protein JWO22_1226 [Frankiales bacterium]|nr:hypothetical protein [Frankiales bacterium]
MRFCTECGNRVPLKSAFCGSCGAQVESPVEGMAPARSGLGGSSAGEVPALPALEQVVPGTPVAAPTTSLPEGAPSPATDGVHAHGSGKTFTERVLGGDWRMPLLVAGPVLLLIVGLAALSCLTQALTGSPVLMPMAFDFTPRTTSSWFHSLAREIATAFGSPLVGKASDGKVRVHSIPLLVSAGGVLAYVALLRRTLTQDGLPLRIIQALRPWALVSLTLLVITLFGRDSARVDGQKIELSASPGAAFGWALLVFGLASAVVVARPLHALSARYPQAADWTIAWRGAKAAVTTAVGLGFLAAIATAFIERDGDEIKLADLASLVPRAVGHAVNYGVDVWQVSVLGRVRNAGANPDAFLAVYDRHGLSLFYIALVLIPVLSVGAGVWSLSRSGADRLAVSRACYRMSAFVVLLYLILAIPTLASLQVPGEEVARFGPEVLLGALLIGGWYLVLGFAAGQLLHPHRDVASHARLVRPVEVAVIGGVLLVVSLVFAVIEKGGKDFQPQRAFSGTFAFGDSSSSENSASGSSDSSSQDSEARSTLSELAAAEESYDSDNGFYTDDTSNLSSYSEPSDVIVDVTTSSDGFCATATGVDSSNYFTYDSTNGSVEDGDNC